MSADTRSHRAPSWARLGRVLPYVLRNLAAREAIFPIYASFKVTHQCGLRCAFCDISAGKRVAEAPLAECRRMIDALAESSTLILCFEGGEPLLHPDIVELVVHAARRTLWVSVVTSYPDQAEQLRPRLADSVDFLQISIDEEHGNLSLLDHLREIRRDWGGRVTVQMVITRDNLDLLDERVERIRAARCKVVLMPSVDLAGARHLAPPRQAFVTNVRRLKRRHPGTIITSYSFLRGYLRGRPCSTASIIVDPDGSVFYPCRLQGLRPYHLLQGRLDDFLLSPEAADLRLAMRDCPRGCGWYQYFAISLCSPRGLLYDLHSGLERIL